MSDDPTLAVAGAPRSDQRWPGFRNAFSALRDGALLRYERGRNGTRGPSRRRSIGRAPLLVMRFQAGLIVALEEVADALNAPGIALSYDKIVLFG
jgi:hypothetical protein